MSLQASSQFGRRGIKSAQSPTRAADMDRGVVFAPPARSRDGKSEQAIREMAASLRGGGAHSDDYEAARVVHRQKQVPFSRWAIFAAAIITAIMHPLLLMAFSKMDPNASSSLFGLSLAGGAAGGLVDPTAMGLAPLLLWQGARTAALFSMGSHFMARALGTTALPVYAILGAACGAIYCYGVQTIMAAMPVYYWAVECICGMVAAGVYRLVAGAKPV